MRIAPCGNIRLNLGILEYLRNVVLVKSRVRFFHDPTVGIDEVVQVFYFWYTCGSDRWPVSRLLDSAHLGFIISLLERILLQGHLSIGNQGRCGLLIR